MSETIWGWEQIRSPVSPLRFPRRRPAPIGPAGSMKTATHPIKRTCPRHPDLEHHPCRQNADLNDFGTYVKTQLEQGPKIDSSTPLPTNNTNTGKFDADKFADTLTKNAQNTSHSACAHYVGNALEDAGIKLPGDRPRDAKNWGPFLEQSGFTPVDENGYTPQKGDVIIHQPYPGGNESGHIAGYTGTKWVSDYNQTDMFGGHGYRTFQPPHVFYRYAQ